MISFGIITSYKTESGFRSDFCQNCGSTVPQLMTNQKQYWVPAGLLEGESGSKVVAHLFVGSKCHWDIIGDSGAQYEEMPDMAT
ncbi:GFA family protein [Thalassomonas viridans]|uniref:GFA family protein n=1 Tax=Thalassomonas viridans TaxID=137584 RepID=A0AAE9Z8H9_9GAMM|nr:GFA family protein [Thalassomonas viridans]